VFLLQIAMGGFPVELTRNARAAAAADLHIGFLQTIDSLNPYVGLNDASYLLYGLIYDYPYAFDQDGNFIPNLVLSASCDSSCMNWTYTVRQGVYWSDGTLLTADDVAFTWNYDSQNLFHLWAYEPYFNQVVQCSPQTRPYCGAAVTAPWTVTVYFARPFAAGEDLFGPIVEKAQWQGVSANTAGTTYPNANPIGTGPFIADPNIYTEFTQLPTVPLHLFRNPRYHPVGTHTGSVNISNIYLHVFSDPTSMAIALQAGDIQLAQTTVAGADTVRAQADIQVQTALQAIQEWDEVGFSQLDTPAANNRLSPARFDINVRLAAAHATNKDYIIQTFYSSSVAGPQGVRGDTLVSPITPSWWYQPTTDNLTFDIAQANAMLNTDYNSYWTGTDGKQYRQAAHDITVSYQTACTYPCADPTALTNTTKIIPAGTHLEFTMAVRNEFPEEVSTANYLQAQWAQIGIKLNPKPEAESSLSDDVYKGYVETYIWYWSADPDPNYILSMESSFTLDGWNDNYWNNATYNQLYLDQLGERNLAQRQADVKDAQKLFYGTGVYIILLYPYGQWVMRTDLWQGWGDWTAHPYRQMNAYWGANPLWFDLNCPTCQVNPTNQPPTAPVITGSTYVSAYTAVNVTFSATSSDAESTDTLNWTWTWGDGNSSTTTGPATTAASTYGHTWERPGNYTITVSVSDGWSSPVPTDNPVYINVTLPPANPGVLTGFVKDLSGVPLNGAQVLASPGNHASSTGASGAYSITLPEFDYTVTASARLYSNQTKTAVNVTSGQTTWANFSLTPNAGWIVGTVTSSTTGAAVQGAVILVTVTTGEQKTGSTDAQGHYNLSVEPGTYTVNATANNYVGQARSGIAVLPGQETSVTFQLVPIEVPPIGLSPLVIGAIAALILIVIAAVVAVFLLRRRKKKETEEAKIDLPPKT